MKKYYRHLYKLNTSHSATNNKDNSHNHTFLIYLVMTSFDNNGIISNEHYEKLEEYINEYFMRYTRVYLNEMPIFNGKIPTIEAMGEAFYEELKVLLMNEQIDLLQLEIGETPVRIYSISDCILIPSQYGGDSIKNWERILKIKKQICNIEGK